MPATADRASIPQLVGQRLLVAFDGRDEPSAELLRALQEYRPAGVTLFRRLNVRTPGQVRQLTARLQQAAMTLGLPPLLIAADQEGGQLMAIGEGATPLPGNMALGAAGSTRLARQAGEVIGRELAAMGINVAYAPCCDVNINPQNPVIGVRSFGEDPERVGELAAAVIEGIQSCGVAATAKHFPGHGDTASDSHHGVPSVPYGLDRLRSVELPPFAAAVRAGVRLVMTAHVALPAVDGREGLPATLSPAVLGGLLRGELGFTGVAVSDAMDMRAIRQGEELGQDALRAAQAGIDLLLMGADPEDQRRAYTSLLQAARSGELQEENLRSAYNRVVELKGWLAGRAQPEIEAVGCAAHRAVADEIAAASLTLVRDRAGLLPLRPAPGDRIAVVVPQPRDLTPADTSSYVHPGLAGAVRRFHEPTREFVVPVAPTGGDIAALLDALRGFQFVVVGTINACHHPGQADLVRAVVRSGIPTVAAALRLPYDAGAIPEAPTFACTYGILEPSMNALAGALFGRAGFPGRLPVRVS